MKGSDIVLISVHWADQLVIPLNIRVNMNDGDKLNSVSTLGNSVKGI